MKISEIKSVITESFNYVVTLGHIEDWEFPIKLGLSREEYQRLISAMDSKSESNADVLRECAAYASLMNEVINSIPVDESEYKEFCGFTIEYAEAAYEDIKRICASLSV